MSAYYTEYTILLLVQVYRTSIVTVPVPPSTPTPCADSAAGERVSGQRSKGLLRLHPGRGHAAALQGPALPQVPAAGGHR